MLVYETLVVMIIFYRNLQEMQNDCSARIQAP